MLRFSRCDGRMVAERGQGERAPPGPWKGNPWESPQPRTGSGRTAHDRTHGDCSQRHPEAVICGTHALRWGIDAKVVNL